mmetsp:Transcript_11083/g.13997  ORF Transcript_11083/g.13997 Transcript_11083/m.13997 type:complete len:221 (+) Transcript_11083:149-811(+)|eukprot:CAMPEP_0203655916 /NCGR_PEP_ID=MMETSP0088-20131115/39681_1 /ASSEMBLY_ACC=CAM_ASM_001087 /TAXON_ID=426623 /ORGANISM="Chaetoceros affinis, Strain CCMP159" /LENGTH=220 /DNA_ID=CAMNT_0050516693 /DNA_START=69 /DNA_END=731 /DNA_ORIENTATION=-
MTAKLYYYPSTGKANQIRLALAAANIDFQDVHPNPGGFPPSKDQKAIWQKIGGNTTTNVPMLEMPDGKVYTQSSAVLRAVGRMGNLMPSSDDAMYLLDKLLADAEDLRAESYKCFRAWGASEESYTAYINEVLPLHLGNFERILVNGSGDFFVEKDKLTVADIAVYDAVVNFGANRAPEGCLDNFVELKKWVDRVESNAGIAAYLSSDKFDKISKFNRTM